MGTVNSATSGLSFLAQTLTGNATTSNTSNPSAQNLSSILEAASPTDAVELSTATVALQQVDGLFGLSQSNDTPLPMPGATPSLDLPPGLSAGDVTDATAAQQQAIASQAVNLQQTQGLFGAINSTLGSLNVLA